MKRFPQVLLQGYQNFLKHVSEEPQFFRRLAEEGQKPEIMIIGCCDSRAAPEIIFDMGPGDIFVTRNIANQVPPYQPDGHFHATSAALEYAVKGLQVKHIIVLGHGRCGGIQAALENAESSVDSCREAALTAAADMESCRHSRIAGKSGKKKHGDKDKKARRAALPQTDIAPPRDDFIGDWMRLLKPAVDAVSANILMTQYERQQVLERISLRFSIENLRSFPWIKAAEGEGRLQLHAAWFDISSAELWLLDERTQDFTQLAPNA